MTSICALIPRERVARADAILAKAGHPLRLQSVIDLIDFDPDVVLQSASDLLDLHDALGSGRPVAAAAPLMRGDVDWVGPASDLAVGNIECQDTFWVQMLAVLQWLGRQIAQLADYLVDAIRVVCAWLAFIASVLELALGALWLLSGVLTGGVGTLVSAIVTSPLAAIIGVIGLVSAAVSLVFGLIDLEVEWSQSIVRDARFSTCGKDLSDLPDWDPGKEWFPPSLPQ